MERSSISSISAEISACVRGTMLSEGGMSSGSERELVSPMPVRAHSPSPDPSGRESLAPAHDFSGGRFLDDEDEEDVSVLGMEVFGILCAKSKCNNGPKDMLKAPSRLGNPLIKDRAFREVRMDKDFEASFMMSNQSQWPLSTSSLSSH